jgi:hypothetical protein
LVEDTSSTVLDRVKTACVCLTEPMCAVCLYPYGYTGYIKWNLVVRLVFGLQPFGDDVPEEPAIIFGRADGKCDRLLRNAVYKPDYVVSTQTTTGQT